MYPDLRAPRIVQFVRSRMPCPCVECARRQAQRSQSQRRRNTLNNWLGDRSSLKFQTLHPADCIHVLVNRTTAMAQNSGSCDRVA